MFIIDNKNNIHMNRGDSITIRLENETSTFELNDIIKFSITKKGNCSEILLQKIYEITELEEEGKVVEISLAPEDTKNLCPIIKSGTLTFWYEIEMQAGDIISTLIGYDIDGPKEFILYPEAERIVLGE